MAMLLIVEPWLRIEYILIFHSLHIFWFSLKAMISFSAYSSVYFWPNFSLSSLNLSSTESYTQGCSSFSFYFWIVFSWHFLTCSTRPAHTLFPTIAFHQTSENASDLFLDPVSLCSYFCETHYSVASWESMHGTWFFWAAERLKMSLVYLSSVIFWLCIEI